MKKASKTRYAILGMLSIEPMSGYEIRQAMKQSTAYFWSESDGQIYPTIATLLEEDLIRLKAEKNISSRAKKTFKITNNGLRELKNWLALRAETQNIRNEFLLKMFFGANMATETALEHVHVYRYEQKTVLNELTQIKEQLEKLAEHAEHRPYWLLSLDYGLKLTTAEIQWCDEVIEYLETVKGKNK